MNEILETNVSQSLKKTVILCEIKVIFGYALSNQLARVVTHYSLYPNEYTHVYTTLLINVIFKAAQLV